MVKRTKRAPRKQCPQCAWDAEGKLVDGGEPEYPYKGKDAPEKYEFECGNCGFQWKE